MASATFHAGEQALQQRAGAYARMAEIGPRVIRPFMPDQHRDFFAELPFLLLGTLDAQGRPWASVLAGPPGFAHSPEPTSLRVDALPGNADPATLAVGAPVGVLGIQPHTRRRNRMNGWIEALDATGFTVRVGQSYGNCPKYIQPREALYAPLGEAPAATQVLPGLDAGARALIERADTFFIATAHPEAAAGHDPASGVDVSHRGGPAGFVRIEGDDTLAVPDFIGNSFFNTLGNLELEPRCGLVFIDHAAGDLLYLAARAELQWEGPAVQAIPGALRLLRLQVTEARRAEGALPLTWRE
jgi:predicted pyridoxine 5'-phosphate oxidase superfamily flavin-nucleotide-binding protein